MRRSPPSFLLCCTIAALSAQAAVAQGESYMALVGELVGAVESPRVVMETCVARKSGRRGDLQPAFEAWRARHAALLTQVDAHLARADARLRAENPDSGARSVADAMNRILQRRYESLDAAALRQLCGRYPRCCARRTSRCRRRFRACCSAWSRRSGHRSRSHRAEPRRRRAQPTGGLPALGSGPALWRFTARPQGLPPFAALHKLGSFGRESTARPKSCRSTRRLRSKGIG